MDFRLLNIGRDVTIAYHRYEGTSRVLPGVMFMGGFRSDMTGTKATYLEGQCKRRHQSFVRFDYTGHGSSSGVFEQCNFTAWLRDAQSVFDELTTGPQIVVGSSMGGWLALLLAKQKPARLAGLVLLAPAPDFSEDIYNGVFGEEERRHLAKKSLVYMDNAYGDPYPLTLQLFQDGKRHLLLGDRIHIPCPVRLIHGRQDADVPWQKSEKILEKLVCPDATVSWVMDGDHRLSRPQDLALIDSMVIELCKPPRLEAAKK